MMWMRDIADDQEPQYTVQSILPVTRYESLLHRLTHSLLTSHARHNFYTVLLELR